LLAGDDRTDSNRIEHVEKLEKELAAFEAEIEAKTSR